MENSTSPSPILRFSGRADGAWIEIGRKWSIPSIVDLRAATASIHTERNEHPPTTGNG